jgi:hypothetical protein
VSAVKDAADSSSSGISLPSLGGSGSDLGSKVQSAADDAGDALGKAAADAKGSLLRSTTSGLSKGAMPVLDNLAAVTMGGRSSYNDPAVPSAINDTASKLSEGQRQSGDVGGNSRSSLNNDASSFSDPAVPSAVNEAASKLSLGQRTSGDVGGSSPTTLQEQNQSYSDPLLSNKLVSGAWGAAMCACIAFNSTACQHAGLELQQTILQGWLYLQEGLGQC